MILHKTNHPQINEVLELFIVEKHPFTKVHRLIDLFEVIIKTHTAYIISDYIQRNQVSDDIKSLLAEGLKTPSLGLWQLFNRLIIEDLMIAKQLKESDFKAISSILSKEQRSQFIRLYDQQGECFILKNPIQRGERAFLHKIFKKMNYTYSEELFNKQFYCYFEKWDRTISQPQKVNNQMVPDIINFRNKYAHGATPDQKTCLEDIKQYTPVLEELLKAEWLSKTGIVVFHEEDGKVQPLFLGMTALLPNLTIPKETKLYQPYLYHENGRLLNLFPILSFKSIKMDTADTPTLLFLNDLKKIKKKQISLLNYPYAYHEFDEKMYEDFIGILNVVDWKRRKNYEFSDKVEELTLAFHGREQEQAKIKNFIDTHDSGHLFLFGTPGIGKSALIAKMIKDFKYSVKNQEDSPISFVEYFIRRNSSYSTVDRFLDSLNQQLEATYVTKIPLGNTIEEKYSNLFDRLLFISTNIVNRKIVICIDGLDEGIHNQLLSYLITDKLKNILFIYSSRQVEPVEEIYHRIHPSDKQKITIFGLNSDEIRGMLYQVTNKYQIMHEPDYIDHVLEKSEGNPLYVKLLCSEIEHNHHTIHQKDLLPKKIEEFYQEILFRLRKEPLGNDVLHTIYVLAVAKEFLSAKHLELILGFNSKVAEEVLSTIQEIVMENPMDTNSYQLFHESFREYLEINKKEQLIEAELSLITFCDHWKSLKYYGNSIRTYPMKYYSTHLASVNDKDKLVKVAANQEYIATQYVWTNQYLYSINLFLDAMKVTTDLIEKMDYPIKIAQLHQSIAEQMFSIIHPARFPDHQEIEKVLKQLSSYRGVEQFLLYILFIHQTLHNDFLDDQKKQEYTQLTLNHLDEHTDLNVIGYKWCDFFSIKYMVHLLVKMKKLGCCIDPIILRSDLQNIDNEYIIYELQDFDLNDPSYFSIISKLFLTEPYFPVVTSFVTLLSKQHLFSKALEVCELIPITSLKLQSLIEIAKSYHQAGKYQEEKSLTNMILSLTNTIEEDYVKVEVLCLIASKLGRVKESYQKWIQEAYSVTEQIKDDRDKSYAWREIAIAEGHECQFPKALTIIRKNVKDTWNQIIALCAVVLDMKQAGENYSDVLEEAFERLKESKDYRDKRSSVRSISIALAKLGKQQEAFQLLKQAKDHWNSLYILRSIGVELSKRKSESDISIMATDLSTIQEQALLIGTFISEGLNQDRLQDAFEKYKMFVTSLKMQKIGPNHLEVPNVQSSTLHSQLENHQLSYEDCIALLPSIDQLSDDFEKSINLARLATKFYHLQQEQLAQSLMKTAEETARTIENSYNRSHAKSEVAKEYSKQNRIEQALVMAKDIEYLWNETALMRQIAHNLSLQKDYPDLFRLIKGQREKNLILVMVDEMLRIVNKSHIFQVLEFIHNDIVSEVVKTHAYNQVLSLVMDYGEDILHVLKEMIPKLSYDRTLICKSVFLYAKYICCFSDITREKKSQILEVVERFVDISSFDLPTITYCFDNREEWLSTISNDDDLLFIKSLVRQVERQKITEQQFQDMIQDFL